MKHEACKSVMPVEPRASISKAMKGITHVMDPEGDVLLVLQRPNLLFVPLSADGVSTANLSSYLGNESSDEDSAGKTPSPASDEVLSRTASPSAESEIRMLLSLKHLMMASGYFRTINQGPWIETIVDSHTFRLVVAHGWDAEALRVLMDIIHGQASLVPRVVNLEFLAAFAVLVDYYQCHDVVEPYSDLWQKKLKLRGDLVPELLVSWVFANDANFRLALHQYLRDGDEPLSDLAAGLPIPQEVIGRHMGGSGKHWFILLMRETDVIDATRNKAMDMMVKAILDCHRQLLTCNEICEADGCNMILLGLVTKFMWLYELSSRTSAPYRGIKVDTLNTVRGIQKPVWYDQSSYEAGCKAAYAQGQQDGHGHGGRADASGKDKEALRGNSALRHPCNLGDFLGSGVLLHVDK